MGIDGLSPLLNLIVMSLFVGFKREWANYRKHMTIPRPDACKFFFYFTWLFLSCSTKVGTSKEVEEVCI